MADRPLHPRPLFYSAHAVQRMQERGFTREDVKRILYLGDAAESSYQKPGSDHRWARQLILRDRPAKVIFVEGPEHRIIVTVEWVHE